jgi:methionine sulfoxide reductase heme-binding subunit
MAGTGGVVGMSGELPVLWLLARAAALVSFAVLTATVLLGVAAGQRTRSTRWPRSLMQGVHRGLSLTGVLLLGIHVVAVVADPYVALDWLDVVIPFRAGFRPTWTGLGTLALDVLVVVVVTSLLRVRLGPRAWKAVHVTAYAAWALSLLHGIGAGTDTGTPWVAGGYAAAFGLVLAATLLRAARRPARDGARLRPVAEAGR